MKTEEKYRRIGEAILKEYGTHDSKEIEIVITSEKISTYLFVSVGSHQVAIFSEREIKQIVEDS